MTVRYYQQEVQVSSSWTNVWSIETRLAGVGVIKSYHRFAKCRCLHPGEQNVFTILRIPTIRTIQAGSHAFGYRLCLTGVRDRRLIFMGHSYANGLGVRATVAIIDCQVERQGDTAWVWIANGRCDEARMCRIYSH